MLRTVCGTARKAGRFCLNNTEKQVVFGSAVVENVWKMNYYKVAFASVLTAEFNAGS